MKSIKENAMKEHIESLVLSMNIRCINCQRFGACESASETITHCTEYQKRSYETKLVKVDGLNYKFEEVK